MARNPEAKTRIRADSGRLGSDLRRAQGKFSRAFGKIGGGIRRSLTGGLTGGLGGLAAGGGAFLLGRQVMDFEESLSMAGVAANATEAQIMGMRDAINAASRETGIAREQILGGVGALGDLIGTAAFSEKVVGQLSDTMIASGASAEDLANLALVLKNSFGFDLDHIEEGFAKILAIGKEGSVPLKQIGPILQGISAQFTEFGLGGEEGLRQITAAVNVLRDKGFGGAEQAGTGLQALMTALTRNADKLRKAGGVRVFDTGPGGVKTFRELGDIMVDISRSKLMRDPKALQDALGGRGEAVRAARAYMGNMGEISRLAELGAGATDVQSDKMRRLAADSRKVQIALNRAKMEFVDEFTPERMESLANAMGKFADLAGFAADHLGKIVIGWATLKGLELAGGLGELISFAKGGGLTKALSMPKGLPGGGAMWMRIGGMIGAGFAAHAAIQALISMAEAAQEKELQSQQDTAFFRGRGSLQDRVLSGQMSPEVASKFLREGGIVDRRGNVNQTRLTGAALGLTDDQAANYRSTRSVTGEGASSEEMRLLAAVLKAQGSQNVFVRIAIDDQGFAKQQAANVQQKRRGTQ